MEWLTCIRAAVDYMERHLTDDIGADDVAKAVYLSPFFLQRGFSLMTGVGLSEYLRNRRLYQAALDLRHTDEKVIDVALRCCYETPESFTKAFTRFHGATPSQIRDGAPIRTFLPLTIHLTIQGGNQMDCRITQMDSFKVVGFAREFDSETSYEKVPQFWAKSCNNTQMSFPAARRKTPPNRRSQRTASANTASASTMWAAAGSAT